MSDNLDKAEEFTFTLPSGKAQNYFLVITPPKYIDKTWIRSRPVDCDPTEPPAI